MSQQLKNLRRRIGRNIHEARILRRMTLERLAAATGLSAATIDRLEIGRGEVDLYHLMKLAEGLRLGEAAFLTNKATVKNGNLFDEEP